MDAKKFKLIYGDAMKNVSSLQDLEKQREEERLRQEEAQAAIQAQDEQKKKDEEAKKGIGQKVAEKAVEIGKGIGGTAERVGGTLAQAGVGVFGAADTALSLAQGNKEEAQKKSDKYSKAITDIGHAKAIDDGSMSFISDKTLEGKNSVAGFGAEFTKAGADTASFIQPELKGAGFLKSVGSEVGINAATTATASAADQYAKTGTVDAGQTIDDALAGGATAGLIRGGRGVLSRLKNGPDVPVDGTKPADGTVDPLAADEAAASKIIKDANAHLSDGQFAKISDNELQNQIDQFQSGARTADTQADYQRYQQLQDEAKFRTAQKEKAAFESNGLPNDPKEAQAALDALDAGEIPDSAKVPMKADIKSVAQIFAHQDLPPEIKSAAQEVMDDQGKVNTMLDGLMNDTKYENSHNAMDQAYNQRLNEIQQMPEPRYVAEREKLDAQYKDDLAELEMIRTKDLPEVEQWNQVKDKLDAREEQVVADTNMLIENNPDSFRVPDEKEVAAQRQALVDNLEQAKRFNEGTPTVERVAESSNPEKELERSPEAKTEAVKFFEDSEIADVKSTVSKMSSVSLAMQRVLSPSTILEKAGLRQVGRDLHTGIIRAIANTSRANKIDANVLKEIKKVLPSDKESLNQIVDYLEGNRKTINLADEKAATMIKEFLDQKKAILEDAGYKTIKDFYFPHIRENNPELFTKLFGEVKATGDVNFGNLKSRTSDGGDYSKDILNVLASYANGLNRKLSLEPALKPLEEVSTQLKLSQAESETYGNFAHYIDGYIKQVKGQDKSNTGVAVNQMIDAGLKKVGLGQYTGRDHYAQSLGLQRMVSATATMGMSVSTALRNSTQIVNTVAGIGPRYAAIGSVDGTRMLLTQAGRDELQRAGIFDGGVSREAFNDLTKNGAAGRFSKAASGTAEGLMSLMHGTDVILRAQAYAGAKAKALDKGLRGVEAENAAIRAVVDTQFMTSRVDMPLAFNGQGMRSLTQLATFNGKQAGLLARMGVKLVRGEDGKGFKMQDAGAVLSAAVSAMILTETLKPVIGMQEKEWIPFYDQIAPVLSGITGQEQASGTGMYRSPLVRLMFGDGKSKEGLLQAIQNNGDFEGFWNDNWSQIIPMGTQLKKSTEGYQTTTSGESRNDKGNIRFMQNNDNNSILNATLFGQYSTENGQNWIKEGFPTLSESQTKQVDRQATRSAKEQYADFYTALKDAGGRQDAYDEVQAAALTGNQTRAAAAAKAYNDKVSEAMKSYYGKYGNDMPQKLRDELERTKINVSKVIDNNTKG